MYILNDINLEEDTLLESYPVCMKDKYNGEISCMGILVKREIENHHSKLEGTHYYQFVYFYGKSPINFSKSDYKELQERVCFDMNIEMVADFRYSFSEYSSSPGLSTSIKNKNSLSDILVNDIMQVSYEYRI